ncbi:Major facilitator superfamily MFS-1 domain containing protein [Aphelenchoides besseyi]|nr:Major facilitator superfamily MFS-1 domain containing protein [Aphelenchoides besseyi]KAI6235023.1 Major facilitator superfamily MFS-1 domain containing protein [Aphelenchoides besseyi]
MADVDGSFASKKLWSRRETRLWTINFFMGTCALYASRVALPICAARMAQEYGWNKTDSGTIMSCFFWGYTITQIIAGSIADRIGGERILNATTLSWSLLTLFTPQLFDFAYWSGSPLFFMLMIRVATGIGQGFHLPSMASMVSRHLTATDKGRVFGICLAGSHFGSVVAGSFGSILLEWFGWRSLFQFVGVLSVGWWASFKFLTEHSLYRGRVAPSDAKQGMGKAKSSDGALLPVDTMKNANENAVPWATLFSHPSFWAASIAQYCGANAYFTMFSWLPSYFSDNFPNAKGVVYNVVPYLAIVVTSLLAPFFATRLLSQGRSVTFTRRFMEGTSLTLTAICLLAVSASSKFYSSLIIFTLAMASRGLHHGGVSVNPHDFAPNHTGSVFGIFNAFSAVTGFIGVYVAGWILQATHDNWTYVFVFTAVQCLFGAVVYCFLGTGNKII